MELMKDSGIEWIKEIPIDWEIKPLKYVFDFISGGTPDSTNSDYWDGEIVWITPADFKTKDVYISKGKRNITDLGYRSCSATLVPAGSVVVSKRAPIGTVGVASYELCTNQGCLSLVSNSNEVYNKYFYYLLSIYDEVLNLYGSGTTFKEISSASLETLTLPFPSFDLQKKVADFLDVKCFEIDTISKDIQSEIVYLEEYKRSVITETVTKGLDNTTTMKYSGEKWIGNIPTNWTITKLGNVMHLRNERNYKPLEEVNLISLYTDKGVVQHSDLDKTSGNIAQNADGYKIVHKDDIVVNIILAWMGAMGISNYYGVTSPAYDVYVVDKNKIVPHYCHYLLRTPAMAGECYKYGRGIMMMRWRTYSTEFKKIKMPLPPIEEQQAIADYLDDRISEIDSIISSKKTQLEVIEQYKKSIIYEYTTGKKEVCVS